MANLDLRHVERMGIIMLKNRAGNFTSQSDPGAPSLIGATATCEISKGGFLINLSIGNGIIITAYDKFAVFLPALSEGVYDYFFELLPINGDPIRLIDNIQVV